ncbi:MAG: TonB-dependent receptor [Prevotellaceae bacterium]|nr:TonB-dependent receptor [Prevotellaceae bacterium]
MPEFQVVGRFSGYLFCKRTIVLSLLVCGFAALHSQNDTIRHLEDVTVTARQNRSVVPAQRLTGEQLENLNALSVADAVRTFAGVQVKDYGGVGGLKTVNIREIGSQHAGVFYDGIAVGDAQNGIVDLGKFSLDNIDFVSLYNGQQNKILLPARDFASANTIYMTSKMPDFQENKKTNLKIALRYGSFGLVNPSANWQQKLSENLYSSFNFEYLHANGRYKFRHADSGLDTVMTRQNGNIETFRAEGGLFGKIKNGKWNAKLFYYDRWQQIPGAIIRTFEYKNYNHEQQWDKNFFVQTSATKQVTEKYKLLLNAKYANDFMRYYNPDTTSILIDNSFYQQEFYVSLAQQYTILDFWNVSFSADYQRNILNSNKTAIASPTRQVEFLNLSTSLNFERCQVLANVLATFSQEKVQRLVPAAKDRQQLSPAVFAKYKLLRKTDFNLHAFYKHIFRLPTFNELYYGDYGNYNLKPELAIQYDIGLDFFKNFDKKTLKNLQFNIDGYFNQVKNKIVAYPVRPSQWTVLNFDKVHIFGVDVRGQNTLEIAQITLNSTLAYTLSNTVNLADKRITTKYGKQLPYSPRHSATVLLNANYKNWSVNYNITYAGMRYTTAENINSEKEKINAWTTNDISVFNRFAIKKINCKAGIEISNIFNRQYEIVKNYPMPRRNAKITLTVSL